MGTSFEAFRKRQLLLVEEMHTFSGVDNALILKLIQYAQMLPEPGNPDIIGEMLFKAQMGYRFGITSQFHLQSMYEAVKRNAVKPGKLHVYDYVKLLCMFYSNNLDLKIDFVFHVYDINVDGSLSSTELNQLLSTAVMSVDDEGQYGEPIRELIDIVLSVMDKNKDGQISIEEYRAYVKKDILFIQLLGQVLPGDSELKDFMAILRRMSNSQLKRYFKKERIRCLKTPPLDSELHRGLEDLYPVKLDFLDFI